MLFPLKRAGLQLESKKQRGKSSRKSPVSLLRVENLGNQVEVEFLELRARAGGIMSGGRTGWRTRGKNGLSDDRCKANKIFISFLFYKKKCILDTCIQLNLIEFLIQKLPKSTPISTTLAILFSHPTRKLVLLSANGEMLAVMVQAWEGISVVISARKLIGATNPLNAEPGTTRGDLAVQTGSSGISDCCA
nr:nucleoside diphosphate kinase 2, chloroplastic [Ipomoea batatas]